MVKEYTSKHELRYNVSLSATRLRQVIQAQMLKRAFGVNNNPVRWLKDARNEEKSLGTVQEPSEWPEMVVDFVQKQGFILDTSPSSTSTPVRQVLAAIGSLSQDSNPIAWITKKRKQETDTKTTIFPNTWPIMVNDFVRKNGLIIDTSAEGTPLYQIYSQHLVVTSPVTWISKMRNREKATNGIINPAEWPEMVHKYVTNLGLTYDTDYATHGSALVQILSQS